MRRILTAHPGSSTGILSQGQGLSITEGCVRYSFWFRMRLWPCPLQLLKEPQLRTPHGPIFRLSRQRGRAACCEVWGSEGHLLLRCPPHLFPSSRLWPRWQSLPSCFSWCCLRKPGPAWGCRGGSACTVATQPGPRLPLVRMLLKMMGRSGCSCPAFGPPSTSQSSKVSVMERCGPTLSPVSAGTPHRDVHTEGNREEGAGEQVKAPRP